MSGLRLSVHGTSVLGSQRRLEGWRASLNGPGHSTDGAAAS